MLNTLVTALSALSAWVVDKILQPILMPLVEANLVPDVIVRLGIRIMLYGIAVEQAKGTYAEQVEQKLRYVKDLKNRQIAEFPGSANEQHYEVPADLYLCLGPWKKYSSGYWPHGVNTLEDSEDAALDLLCQRAQISNTSMRVLDMGCGWGSAALYIASHFPKVHVTAMSNSKSQKDFIDNEALQRGLKNVTVVTSDINTFQASGGGKFDRVITIEMMEHVKNYEKLLARVSSWLKPNGKLFVHIFTHKHFPFHYEDGWMAKNFFTGGQMPSDDLLLHFQKHVTLVDHWILPGNHYARTCEAWLQKFDCNRSRALEVTAKVYGPRSALKWFVNWRLFFIACAELFAFRGGNEWAVSHYLFENNASSV
jgi:cyclopropane-fatty-acyl-phospholipid synthase